MTKTDQNHNELKLINRSNLYLDGVLNILNFEPDYLTLEIDGGQLNVEGEELKINNLSKEGGRVEITGKILGLYYSEKRKIKTKFRGSK